MKLESGNSTAKSCELGHIPTTLLYENRDILRPTIMNICRSLLLALYHVI